MKKILCYYLRSISCLFLLSLLTACAIKNNDAPVIDGWKQSNTESSDYRVQKDDTLYSIAWSFGVDYRELAQLNHLQEPYDVQPGQTLRMSVANKPPSNPTPAPIVEAEAIPQPSAPPIVAEATAPAEPTPVETPAPAAQSEATPEPTTTTPAAPAAKAIPAKTSVATTNPKTKPPKILQTTNGTSKWLWPTQGAVVRGFSATSGGNKGVDISGQLAQPITATAAGKVVYTGASLPGYGNLIIIKHTDNELSAYAFNKVIAVKEGQAVKAGQVIAHMGKNDSGKALLHFEIRKNGKPVDPMPYLSKK